MTLSKNRTELAVMSLHSPPIQPIRYLIALCLTAGSSLVTPFGESSESSAAIVLKVNIMKTLVLELRSKNVKYRPSN